MPDLGQYRMVSAGFVIYFVVRAFSQWRGPRKEMSQLHLLKLIAARDNPKKIALNEFCRCRHNCVPWQCGFFSPRSRYRNQSRSGLSNVPEENVKKNFLRFNIFNILFKDHANEREYTWAGNKEQKEFYYTKVVTFTVHNFIIGFHILLFFFC